MKTNQGDPEALPLDRYDIERREHVTLPAKHSLQGFPLASTQHTEYRILHKKTSKNSGDLGIQEASLSTARKSGWGWLGGDSDFQKIWLNKCSLKLNLKR